jgi:hypothetical protein
MVPSAVPLAAMLVLMPPSVVSIAVRVSLMVSSQAATSATTFTYAASTFEGGPFLDQNSDDSITVTASAATGSGITITASAAIFAAGHVGALFQVQAKDFSTVNAWEAGMKGIAISERTRSDGKVYAAATAGTTGTNPPIHASGSEWDGQLRTDINDDGPYGVQWTYLHDKFGIARITAVAGDGLSATADVVRRLPDQVTSIATPLWAHSAVSLAEGWPSHVVHWQGRQIHFKGFDMLASVVGDYGGGRVNFQAYTSSGATAADLAFRRRMDSDNPPLWVMADNKKLLIGTATVENAIGPTNSALAVAGDNISREPQSFYGSEAVQPVQIATQTVFVERGGRRLRAADYEFGSDRYRPDDLTAAARHVTASGIVQLAYQRVPYALLYGVRGDGQLVVHPNTRLEMKGFARTQLGGGAQALSAVSVVGADGTTDELWLLVRRGALYEIWKQAAWRDLGAAQDQAFYVDCGTQVSATAGQTRFTGFTHLAGQAVAVLAGGGVIPNITVASDGSIDLPEAAIPAGAYTVTIGLPYTAEAVTLRPNVDTRAGPSMGLLARVRKTVLRVLETIAIKAGALDRAPENLINRSAAMAMDAPIALFTGDTEGAIATEYSRDGRIRFVSEDPLPAVIQATILSIEVDQADA